MLLGEKSEEDQPKQSYVLGNEYVGTVSEAEKESTARYYVTDEQGSIRYVLHGNGEVESHYQYDAFGERITQEGNQSRLQYNSQIWDEVSGLYYLRARYYNPRTGRFTQEDVIYDDGLNLYAYCNSNPVIYSDPSGFAKNGCEVKEGDKGSDSSNASSKRQSQDQKALHDLAKEAAKNAKNGKPISYKEAQILDMWAKEYNVPQHHQAYPGSGQHFPGGNYSDHTHIYNIHVPYRN